MTLKEHIIDPSMMTSGQERVSPSDLEYYKSKGREGGKVFNVFLRMSNSH